MHGKANHIMCAYRFTGSGPLNQDCIDDREYGGSRTILAYIKSKKLSNIALFVVRYYGGVHLGSDRFTIIKNSAKEAYEKLINTSFDEMDTVINDNNPQDNPESTPPNLVS